MLVLLFHLNKLRSAVTVSVKSWHPFKLRRQPTCAAKMKPLARRFMPFVLISSRPLHLVLLTVKFIQRMLVEGSVFLCPTVLHMMAFLML